MPSESISRGEDCFDLRYSIFKALPPELASSPEPGRRGSRRISPFSLILVILGLFYADNTNSTYGDGFFEINRQIFFEKIEKSEFLTSTFTP